MAPFGPVPAMVGKETSFNAPVSRRNVSSASTVSISVSAPDGASRSIQARNRASATASRWCAVRVPSISVMFLQAFSSAVGSLQMVARAVGELAVIDEDFWAAILRHQRIGQRQWRMRDVGAADIEGP